MKPELYAWLGFNLYSDICLIKTHSLENIWAGAWRMPVPEKRSLPFSRSPSKLLRVTGAEQDTFWRTEKPETC